MKVQTQRWIDRWIGQLLCAGVSVWARLMSAGRAPAKLGNTPRHILIILLSEMGSVVLAGPMFAALRQRYPSATLHVLQLKKNHAMLLVEHDMDAVFALADHLTVMVNGEVIASGAPAAVRANPDVQSAYLGEEAA